MLDISDLAGGYGATRVLHGVDLSVRAGSVHMVMGRNGVGKTTLMRAIMGLLPICGGEVRFCGEELKGKRPYQIARRGIGYVPETRDIFASLTVAENLSLAGRLRRGDQTDWSVERIYSLFPRLAERRRHGGNQLSGGEMQMLAIGRVLLMAPLFLLLDEPAEGLSPLMVRDIFTVLRQLREEGLTLLVVERNFEFATRLGDQISLMDRGRCVWSGTAAGLRADRAIYRRWLGV